MSTLARILPTLLLAAGFLTLALLIASLCVLSGRVQARRDARRAERAAGPSGGHEARS